MWSFEYNGTTLPVANMFDVDGVETGDPSQAFTLVAGPLPDGKWLASRCLPGDIKPMRMQ